MVKRSTARQTDNQLWDIDEVIDFYQGKIESGRTNPWFRGVVLKLQEAKAQGYNMVVTRRGTPILPWVYSEKGSSYDPRTGEITGAVFQFSTLTPTEATQAKTTAATLSEPKGGNMAITGYSFPTNLQSTKARSDSWSAWVQALGTQVNALLDKGYSRDEVTAQVKAMLPESQKGNIYYDAMVSFIDGYTDSSINKLATTPAPKASTISRTKATTTRTTRGRTPPEGSTLISTLSTGAKVYKTPTGATMVIGVPARETPAQVNERTLATGRAVGGLAAFRNADGTYTQVTFNDIPSDTNLGKILRSNPALISQISTLGKSGEEFLRSVMAGGNPTPTGSIATIIYGSPMTTTRAQKEALSQLKQPAPSRVRSLISATKQGTTTRTNYGPYYTMGGRLSRHPL